MIDRYILLIYYIILCTISFSFLAESMNAVPTTTNYAVEFPAFGEIAGASTPGVKWISLTLGKPLS